MNETSASSETGRGKRSWIVIALAISLSLNLLVAGLVAGALIWHGLEHRDGGRRLDLGDVGFGPFVAALPPRDRRELARAVAREEGSFRENRALMIRQFETLLAALRADPYDPEAVRALLVEQQRSVGARQDLGRELLLERIGEMSAAERADSADALARLLRRSGKRDHKRD